LTDVITNHAVIHYQGVSTFDLGQCKMNLKSSLINLILI